MGARQGVRSAELRWPPRLQIYWERKERGSLGVKRERTKGSAPFSAALTTEAV